MSTKPRRAVRGTTYLITRRCTQRQYLLQPNEQSKQIIEYALAYAAEKYELKLHAFCFLSNHYHLVASDPHATVSRFLQLFHSLVARALNAHFGRWENLWSTDQASLVELVENSDIVDKMVYTICNPVSSYLVKTAKHWPGVKSSPDDLGTTRSMERSDSFFREEGPTAESVELAVVPPLGFSVEEMRSLLAERVQEREASLNLAARKRGTPFLGLRRLYAQRHDDKPGNKKRRRTRSPRFACKNKQKRLEKLFEYQQFVREYYDALKDFANGMRDTLFPHGTLMMRERFSVRIAAP